MPLPAALTVALVLPALAQQLAAPQIRGEGWKDCAFNDRTIPCVDRQRPDGVLILWKDGIRMRYRQEPPRWPGGPAYLRDTLGGLWRRERLQQGNVVLTNLRNGNRIFIPLRFPCRPPLRGEEGYCRE